MKRTAAKRHVHERDEERESRNALLFTMLCVILAMLPCVVAGVGEPISLQMYGLTTAPTISSTLATASGSFVYIVARGPPCRVEKLSFPGYELVMIYTCSTGLTIRSAGNDGTYGYFGLETSMGILKIRLDNMTLVGTYPFTGTVESALIGTQGFGYFIFQSSSPRVLRKVDLTTMSIVGTPFIVSDGGGVTCIMIDSTETFGYFIGYVSSAPRLQKLRLSTFSIEGMAETATATVCAVDPFNDTVGYIASSVGMDRWNLDALTFVSSFTVGETFLDATVVGSYVYFYINSMSVKRILMDEGAQPAVVSRATNSRVLFFLRNDTVGILEVGRRVYGIYGLCDPASHMKNGTASCTRCPVGYVGCGAIPPAFCTFCVPCGPGTRSSADGTSCTLCEAGTYAAGAGSSSCAPCSTSSLPGASTCNSLGCPRGSYEASNGTCVSCGPGEFSATPGSIACSLCPGGTFSTVVGATSSTECVRCAAGSYTEAAGSISCTPCPAGTYSTRAGASSSAFCLFCAAGTWSSTLGSNSSDACVPCEAGTYSAVVAAASISTCIACVEGTYSSKTGAAALSDCTACPAGSFGNTSASHSSGGCHLCPEGSYSLAGSTICSMCDEGTYGPRPGAKSAASCISCPPGTYQPDKGVSSVAMCKACPGGTYNSGFAASSEADCTRCPLGSYSGRIGSPSPTSCELCPAGTFGEEVGATNCTLCPQGTFSSAVGATNLVTCLPCAAGSYSNVSLAAALGGSVAACALCPPGYFQNNVGSSNCSTCPAGSFRNSPGATSCTPCGPGTFCPDGGCAACPQCPQGSYQPGSGSTTCVPCSSDLASLPEGDSSHQSVEHVVRVCSPLQHSFSINWGPVTDPSILYADAHVAISSTEATNGSTFSWLALSVLQSSLVVATAVSVPSAMYANPVVLSVNVTQTCRTTPWASFFRIVAAQVFPSFSLSASSAFDFDTAGEASVKACPDFEFRFTVNAGSCPDKTVIKALRVSAIGSQNFTAVPDYVKYTYDQGTLAVYGTVPDELSGSSLLIVAAAFLDGSRFISSETVSVVRHDVESTPIFTALDTLHVAACPYVRVVFAATPAACGLTVFGASLCSGLPLPSFLTAHVTNAQVIVSGVVPVSTPPFSVCATATVVGALNRRNYSSGPVSVIRPASVTPQAVSADVSSDDGSLQHQLVINGTRKLNVVARYGIALRLALRLSDASASSDLQCTSQILLVGTNDGQPLSGVSDVSNVPGWLATVSAASSSMVFSGMPGQSVISGERSEFFVSAFDGVLNPIVHILITVLPSLSVSVRPSNASLSNVTALILSVASPSPIVSVSAQISASPEVNVQLSLVCPAAGSASAVCSFDSVSGTLGAFGTVDGINKVLFGLRLAVSSSTQGGEQSTIPGGDVSFVLSDSVNPTPVVLTLPASQIAGYDGVQLAFPIVLPATLGRQFVASLSQHFVFPAGSATFELAASQAAWIAVSAAGMITGIPQGPAGIVSGSLLVRDDYVKQAISFSVNVSLPRAPQLVFPEKPVTLIIAETGVTSDMALDPALFVDPENGTLQFQLRLWPTRSTLLPSFIIFDAPALHLSLSPVVTDIGSYTLELLAISEFQSPDWHGNASCLIPIRVDLSWKDFFQQLYEIVGYVTFVLSAIGIPWVFRAFLYNTLCFRRYQQPAAQVTFINTKSFTVSDPIRGTPIPAAQIAAVSINPLASRSASPGLLWSCVVPQYVDRLLRQEANPYHTVANVGVSWATQSFPNGTRVINVDNQELARLVQRGEVRASQQFLLEATYGSWLRRDMIAISFEFTASGFLKGTADVLSGDVDIFVTPPLVEEWGDADLLHLQGHVDTTGQAPLRAGDSTLMEEVTRLDAEVCSLRLLLGQLQSQVQGQSLELAPGSRHQDPYQHAFCGATQRRDGNVSPTLASIFGEYH